MRPAIIVASLLLLASVVGLVLLNKRSSADLGSPPPDRCLSLWNENAKALRYGSHNFSSHGYGEAEVLLIDRRGEADPEGDCAVIFPSISLDPEPVAAAQVFRRGKWMPLSKAGGLGEAGLAKLQADAVLGSNAVLRSDGSLNSLF